MIHFIRKLGGRYFSDDLFIDMDGVMFDFEGKALEVIPNLAPEGTPERKQQIDDCQKLPNFYLDLEPIPGAVDAYHILKTKYNVEILSAPSWDNPLSYTEKRLSLERHFGSAVYKNLTLTHNKGRFTGRALIDDRNKYGVDKFKGEWIQFGSKRFPNWEVVVKHLM